MENRNANTDRRDAATRPDRHAALSAPVRRLIGYGVGGAVGGGGFAIIQHLGPDLLTNPTLVRWVFLYTLLGGVITGVWQVATQWAATWFSLSRRGSILTSGLVAGTLLAAAALVVAVLKQGAGAGAPLLLRLPWTDGLGGFVGGAIGGGLWQSLRP